ncbi:MAG: hypothetical protein ABR949_04315 [Candidatus Aquilonibacter sp.]
MKYQDLRRLAIAFACAIALHEIAVAFIPRQRPIENQEEPFVARVTIARIVRTPTPAPTPTPMPVRIAVSQTTAGLHARVEPVKHAGAKRPTPPKVRYATPDAAVPTGGQGAGAANGQDAGSLSDTSGNGSGLGSSGNGNGAAICGAVDFESTGLAKYDSQHGDYERSNIIATVYYADGSSERIPLDWIWRYKSEDNDPFASSVPLLFQFPPTEQRASEPPIIQYIMAHTTADGRTRLNDRCPNIPPPPASASPQP